MTASRSFFAPDLFVTGTVSGPCHLDLQGRVEGDVAVGSLSLGRDGALTGNARTERAELAGALVGTIRARTVTIGATGRLSGLVEYETLGITPGGVFEAECRPTRAPAAERRAAAPAPAGKRLAGVAAG